jgi:uncharacterized SAM-binding protein YcdF (DUF218 family)
MAPRASSAGAALLFQVLVVAAVLRRPLKGLLLGAGFLLLAALLLACTRLPFDMHRWLGSGAGECHAPAERIVVLGGSGMPSAAELLRLHRAAELARAMPNATVLVVHPGDPAVLGAMLAELQLRGVGVERLRGLNVGENTREQALAFVAEHPDGPPSVALVTAPENMYRSVRAFRRAGVGEVCGVPAWDHAMDHHFRFDHRAAGGRAWVPDVSARTGLRYTFWNYLKLEVTCLRECAAIAYYRVNGWM